MSEHEQSLYRLGERLGCPTCATGEEHVCPFIQANAYVEPRRSRVLAHLRAQFEEDAELAEHLAGQLWYRCYYDPGDGAEAVPDMRWWLMRGVEKVRPADAAEVAQALGTP